MYFGVQSHDRATVENSVLGLAKASKVFNVPCILTTVEAKEFSGNMYSKLQQVYPNSTPIDRTYINCWEDENVKKVVKDSGRKNIVIAGLWTEACVLFPTLTMMHDGYKVFVVADACGGATKEAHEMAMQRMIQAGASPVTWMQVMLEWQRDWNNKDTYNAVMDVVKEHGGAYGLGVEYSQTMTLPAPQQTPQQMQQNKQQQKQNAESQMQQQQSQSQQSQQQPKVERFILNAMGK
jgi:nicotinamidase-related amidase